ncbi:cyclic nucleotide-binding-like protein [Syncephalastrum racemosum]|uniref:cAMP-dependent protein kinase regulatory subunit n=1 Tax=Syncephalastrum racemosum TaxID=13706 RepID=A0A1X2H6W4_SYNRA|nr:cyclic nucleotide-binding-like protein [Syncephalastrum racemosum]
MTIPAHLSEEYAAILNELTSSLEMKRPVDVLQFCSDFFQAKLAEQQQIWPGQQHHQHHYFDEHAVDGNKRKTGLIMKEIVPYKKHKDMMLDPNSNETLMMHPTALMATSPSPSGAEPVPTLQSSYEPYSTSDEEEDEEDDLFEDEDTFGGELPDFSSSGLSYNRGRRTSVSAESMTPSRNKPHIKKVIPKTEAQRERIKLAIANNFLFRNLDENQDEDVVNAMAEKVVRANEQVIEQGAIGDYFYIVESGSLDCYIDGSKVTTYGPAGSFGELALMYNSPRAATIRATTDGILWALDRVTFRRILMENTAQKRYMYETFLAEVPILTSLDSYERFKIADALETVVFEAGETVIEQGSVGENFYLIESGEAAFFQRTPQGEQKEINCLGKGAYFGELALINDSPRAATVVARGRLRCATLGKRGFKRLLGPIMDILKRNSENYARIMREVE